ncbi:BlaI/MecI/CopY family transcriptional regulator [Ruminococcus gauvreauii]|uniref:BlaI/MecI/CopY family transcriptional regulator n=1 Tax=Ruminococcus gauvreauii TaxID=438033 RepID=UPI003983F3F2
MGKYRELSESEMLIMELLWERHEKMSASEIMQYFQDRNWKMTTVSTFLSRMIEKGVVSSERSGRKFLYRAAVTRKELKRRQAWSFIRDNFSSVKDFVLALDDERISEEEARKIEDILSKIEESQ